MDRTVKAMGILDGIVEWIAEQIMYGLDLINTSVLGALGCDMNTFLRYFPAAKTMYKGGDLSETAAQRDRSRTGCDTLSARPAHGAGAVRYDAQRPHTSIHGGVDSMRGTRRPGYLQRPANA